MKGMKIELSIKEDKQLRDAVKDMIRGQVVKIARESLVTLMLETVERKIKNNDVDISTHLRDAIYKQDFSKVFREELEKFLAERADEIVHDRIAKFFNEKDLEARVTKIMKKSLRVSVGDDK